METDYLELGRKTPNIEEPHDLNMLLFIFCQKKRSV